MEIWSLSWNINAVKIKLFDWGLYVLMGMLNEEDGREVSRYCSYLMTKIGDFMICSEKCERNVFCKYI